MVGRIDKMKNSQLNSKQSQIPSAISRCCFILCCSASDWGRYPHEFQNLQVPQGWKTHLFIPIQLFFCPCPVLNVWQSQAFCKVSEERLQVAICSHCTGGTQSLHLIFRVLYSKISTVPRATKSGAHGDAARTTGARA